MRIDLKSNNLPKDADWYGTDAAFTCPICKKVFIVSSFLKGGKRECPVCKEKSRAFCTAPADNGGVAYLEYETPSNFWKTPIDIPYWQLWIAVAGGRGLIRIFFGYPGQVIDVVLDMIVVVVTLVGAWKLSKLLLNKYKQSWRQGGE